MKFFKLSTLVALVVTVLSLTSATSLAQNQNRQRGNFDPEAFRQRMLDQLREQMDVKDDSEWKTISDRVTKVMEARREVGFGGMGFRGGPRRGGGAGGGGDDQAGGNRRGRGFGGEPSPEAEALQKAIDSKASTDEIKAKLAKYRDSRKEKRAKLEQTQDDLRKVLTGRQEAVAVMNGLLE
jgi:hypothetical protein